MTNVEPARSPVLIPFVCPICAGPNAIELIVLSRAGGTSCATCTKWLRSADVMRAIHSPRRAAGPADAPRSRSVPVKRAEMVWPPTAESRASIAPMSKRKGDGS